MLSRIFKGLSPSPYESTSEWAIETHELCKFFGKLKALDQVSLQVKPGAIGLLGPNGAGKTTLMKCLLQLQHPTKGTARLLGKEVGKEGREIRMRIGYTPEQDCHIPGMVGCEYVTYCARLSGLPFESARQRAHEMLDFVGMGQERYRKVDTYSTGLKQRLKLAQAIVHDPDLVFLDEPTNGLDPKGREQILDLIHGLWKHHGICIVLSSHLLHDVDRICDQVIIIAKGKVVVNDEIRNLKSRREGEAEILVNGDRERLIRAFESKGWTGKIEMNGRIRLHHGNPDIQPVLELMSRERFAPLDIIPSPNALEEFFVHALKESHESD